MARTKKNRQKTAPAPRGAQQKTMSKGQRQAIMAQDIEDLAKKRKDKVPHNIRSSYLYETDPINNPIAPRPLVGGVGRRGKLYELNEEVVVTIGTGGVGYVIFNPDVELYGATSASPPIVVPRGPISGQPIATVTGSTFSGDRVTNASGLATGESSVFWTGSKYAASTSPGNLWWQCCGYGLRVTRETAALDQDGSVVLYRSYSNTSMANFERATLTGNKNYRVLQGADLAPNGREIILSGVPIKVETDTASTDPMDTAPADSTAWHNARYLNANPVRGGIIAWFQGTAGHKFRVELVAGFMLYGREVSPKVRFPASAAGVDMLSNVRLNNLRPGRDNKPEETRKAVDAVLAHEHNTVSGVSEFIFKTAPHAIKRTIELAEKIGHILPA